MRYIKTYESFNVNETMDMFTLPVDPIKGAADVYKDIYNSIKDTAIKPVLEWLEDKGYDLLESIKPSKESVKKIYDFMMKTFGTISPDLNSETVSKMIDALKLEKVVKENYQEDDYHTVEGENIIVKILGTLKYLFGLNIASGGLLGLVAGLVISGGSGFVGALTYIGAFIATWILFKILEVFGYYTDDTAAVGYYDKSKDKFPGRFKDSSNTPPAQSSSYKIPIGGLKRFVFKDGKIQEEPGQGHFWKEVKQ